MRETALIVEVPEAEPFVRELRAVHDPVATRGVPGHITTLFPFVPPDRFDDHVLDTVAAVAVGVPAFRFDLVAVDEFPDAVWLRPDPDEPLRDLTRRMWDAFPEYPPYGGRHPDSQPHLTVAIVDTDDERSALAERVRAHLGPHLPIHCTAAAISVFMADPQGMWHRAHRLELPTEATGRVGRVPGAATGRADGADPGRSGGGRFGRGLR